MFLSKNDTIKLGDLGIAKNLDEYGKNSNIGTPSFKSPELFKGEKYSYNTDIWSLGCVVYELIFLKAAFSAADSKRDPNSLDFKDSILTNLTKK